MQKKKSWGNSDMYPAPHPTKKDNKRRRPLSGTYLSLPLASCVTSKPSLPQLEYGGVNAPTDISMGHWEIHWCEAWSTVASLAFSVFTSVLPNSCLTPISFQNPSNWPLRKVCSGQIRTTTCLIECTGEATRCLAGTLSAACLPACLRYRLADYLNIGPRGQKSEMSPPTTW